MTTRRRALGLAAWTSLMAAWASCSFDSTLRWAPPEPPPDVPPLCEVGDTRCTLVALEECVEGAGGGAADGLAWEVKEACLANGQVCVAPLEACKDCTPDQTFCSGLEVRTCDGTGDASTLLATCDPSVGEACRSGTCANLCALAQQEKSNVGCEYWAVDLDNAMIDLTSNAAAQQFAVVVSNPQPDVPVEVRIFQDDGAPGDVGAPVEVAQAILAPNTLRVFKLGPREVDGSPPGEYDTGTHTALTRHAFRISSDFPVVAYQFNPLENVNVFSNDASLLKSREALTYDSDGVSLAYVVAGWPQTIAVTDDPNTNFNPQEPINLRAFLTIVGTTEDTDVVIYPTATIRGGGPVPQTPAGGKLEMRIGAFDVLNLETLDLNAFGADFTGTRIEASQPIAVFSGGEASDAPRFDNLIERRCCADHLEEQLDPIRTAGRGFALAHSPSRTTTVEAAGGDLGVAPEPEYFRFVAAKEAEITITTTLPAPNDTFKLFGLGDFRDVETTGDFLADASEPVHVVQVMASQDAANVPRGLPGGDPSLLVVPPREQFRTDYTFLTPDKYAFDFVTVVAPTEAEVLLDELPIGPGCVVRPTDGLTEGERGGPPEEVTYQCQLSYAVVNPDTGEVTEGAQNDGVHRVRANLPVGVLVFGFDAFVSYAYAAGTELREISVPN